MTKKIEIVVVILGVMLIAAAASMLIYNHMEDIKAGEAAQALLPELKQVIDNTGAVQPPEMATVEIEGYDYIGYLFIPKLKMELPIMSEWDYNRLKIAPCRQFGSVWTDDLVIAGHNFSRHFGSLSKITVGDAVAFIDVNGKPFNYIVSDIKRVMPTEVDWVKHSGYDLLLYTCTYGGKSRQVICCNRTEN